MIDTVKWLATAVMIVGAAVNSMGYWPEGPLVLILGGLLWLWCSLAMKDRPLIVTNLFVILAGTLPLLYKLFWH